MGRSKASRPPAGVPGPGDLDQRWHLASTPHEVNVTELEFALMRVRESFERWQGECFAAASGLSASGSENALLHTIRLHERAKPLRELARLTNRDDVPNMQYALRKLTKLGLIEQIGNRSNAVYQVTDKGREISDLYAELRSRHLIEFTEVVKDMDERLRQTTQTLNLLSGIYEQAARVTATHQRFTDGR